MADWIILVEILLPKPKFYSHFEMVSVCRPTANFLSAPWNFPISYIKCPISSFLGQNVKQLLSKFIIYSVIFSTAMGSYDFYPY